MKTLSSVYRVLCFVVPFFAATLALTGCVQPDAQEIAQEASFQADETECSDLSTEDLDLSAGFTGITRKNVPSNPVEFEVNGYDGVFGFQTSVPGNCHGICSMTIKFYSLSESPDEEYVGLEINALQVQYWSGSTLQTESVNNYSWSYPNLEIQDVVVNALGSYSIDFIGTLGNSLDIESVTTSGGLCIVDNVDLTDPPALMQGASGEEIIR